MTERTRTTIPSAPTGANRRPAWPGTAPTRGQLSAVRREPLKLGEPDKADLFLCDLGQGQMVVKDFAGKRAWVRGLGRIQIARELRAYRHLGDVEGVPRLVGRIDAHALAVERIHGRPLGLAPDRAREGAARLGQLRAIIDALHARGLVHWDLRARDNVMIDESGRVIVLDFASAVHLRPGGLAHRLLFRAMRAIDESAYLKWKQMLDAGPLSGEEQRALERFRAFRSLWPFKAAAWRRGPKR